MAAQRAFRRRHGSTVVHGDYRNGNFIVGRDGIRAVLDWELVHHRRSVGRPRVGLHAIVALRRRQARSAASATATISTLRTNAHRGMHVDRDAVHWWEVMSSVKWGVMTIAQAFTHLLGHVPSLELAAIGRRTVETRVRRARADQGPLMQDRPTAAELLQAAQEFVRDAISCRRSTAASGSTRASC